MITQQSIQQVRDLSIIEVVSHYIKVKRQGSRATACCPFHQEKTGSFSLSDTKNIFKCFGCGKSGDGIGFVMDHERLDFIEAVTQIAAKCGIALEMSEPADPVKYKEQQTRQHQQAQCVQYAIEQYHQQLLALPADHPVITHLFNRGWNLHTIIKWKLGWCNPEWRQVTERLVNDNLYEAAKAIGIIRTGKDNSHYDAYRSRIIFPIENTQGRYIGLGGRWLPIQDKDLGNINAPKYLNSTSDDNTIYQKSNVLYGLHQAASAIKKRAFVWLVEGYADTISMHAWGDANTIGTCGTALTVQQADTIKRYAKQVVLLRDGDNAGQKAAMRDIPILLQQGINVKIAQLPDNKDPDDYIKSLKAITNN